jgi:hypothetical protein
VILDRLGVVSLDGQRSDVDDAATKFKCVPRSSNERRRKPFIQSRIFGFIALVPILFLLAAIALGLLVVIANPADRGQSSPAAGVLLAGPAIIAAASGLFSTWRCGGI